MKPVLEKIKNSSGAGQSGGEPATKSAPTKAPVEEVKKEAPAPKNSFEKKAEEKKKAVVKKEEPAPPSHKAKNDDDDEVTIKVLNKKKREQMDMRTKYPLNEVKGDHIEKL